jgi:CheY-like chemotaxis protein
VRRVLVAEDNGALRELIVAVLVSDGYHVTAVNDGQALIEAVLGGETFDAIVTDLAMPRRDGLEVLHDLRSAGLDIPVLLITTFPEACSRKVAQDLGATLLAKPFNIDDLRVLVRSLTSGEVAASGPRRTKPVG